MPTISIKRHHTLAHAEAKAAADRIARDLNARFDLAYEWDRDDVSFERSGLSGNMHVGKNDVRVDVQLSLLLAPLKGSIEREIQKKLDALFGKA